MRKKNIYVPIVVHNSSAYHKLFIIVTTGEKFKDFKFLCIGEKTH